MVLTKTRHLLFLNIPRGTVMPWRGRKLGRGAGFRSTTSNQNGLKSLHNSLVQALGGGVQLCTQRIDHQARRQELR